VSHSLLAQLAARLEDDLRLRFCEIIVRFAQDNDGFWVCHVDDGPENWGETGTSFDDSDLSPGDAERLLAEVTFNVADNLWPDELTAPWPVCPRHCDHPLQARFVNGYAAWVCLQDADVTIPVGALSAAYANSRPGLLRSMGWRSEEIEALNRLVDLIGTIDKRHGGERRQGRAFSVEARLEGSYPQTVLRLRARNGADDEVCYDEVFPIWERSIEGHAPTAAAMSTIAFTDLEEDTQGQSYFLFTGAPRP
jgi:hypothetical protein